MGTMYMPYSVHTLYFHMDMYMCMHTATCTCTSKAPWKLHACSSELVASFSLWYYWSAKDGCRAATKVPMHAHVIASGLIPKPHSQLYKVVHCNCMNGVPWSWAVGVVTYSLCIIRIIWSYSMLWNYCISDLRCDWWSCTNCWRFVGHCHHHLLLLLL